jgi:hypothetical protein
LASVQEKIQTTVQELKKISAELESQNIDAKLIKEAIFRFEGKKKAGIKPVKKGETAKGLIMIFTFYAKQHMIAKSESNFEEYLNKGLLLADFLSFCKDFGILCKEKMQKQELTEIYKVNCAFKRQMNQKEFEKALQHIANKLFSLSPKENLSQLYDFLQLNKSDHIKNTAKGVYSPFSSEKIDVRASAQRIRLPSDKNLPRVSQLPNKRFMSNQDRKKKTKHFLLPCDAIAMDVKKNSYSSNMIKKLNPMTFTWQTLRSMNVDQYVNYQNLNELVVSDKEDDEILEKHYGGYACTPIVESREEIG